MKKEKGDARSAESSGLAAMDSEKFSKSIRVPETGDSEWE
jgi:hypothetical protein